MKKVAARPAGAPKKRPPTARPAALKRRADDDEPTSPSKKGDWRSQVSEEDWKVNAGREPEAFVVDRPHSSTATRARRKGGWPPSVWR
jgi:hypothetical protein